MNKVLNAISAIGVVEQNEFFSASLSVCCKGRGVDLTGRFPEEDEILS